MRSLVPHRERGRFSGYRDRTSPHGVMYRGCNPMKLSTGSLFVWRSFGERFSMSEPSETSTGRTSNRRTCEATRSLKSQRWYLAENDRKPCRGANRRRAEKAQGRTMPGSGKPGKTRLSRCNRQRDKKPHGRRDGGQSRCRCEGGNPSAPRWAKQRSEDCDGRFGVPAADGTALLRTQQRTKSSDSYQMCSTCL